MKKRLLLSAFIFFISAESRAQFVQTDFKANCNCTLEKEFEKPAPGGYMVTSYKCVSNSLGDVTLYRVMMMDLSKDFKRIPAGRETDYINGYYSSLITDLQNAKIDTDEKSFNGNRTIEYRQLVKYNGETLPQKTMVFMANKKSITLQMLSSSNMLDKHFDEFRNSFVLVNK